MSVTSELGWIGALVVWVAMIAYCQGRIDGIRSARKIIEDARATHEQER